MAVTFEVDEVLISLYLYIQNQTKNENIYENLNLDEQL